jgi:hypothetical protein
MLWSAWRIKKTKSMSNSNDKAWKTKYGPRRVRQDLPTLEEAIFAAQGLSDDPDEQAAIAASLMGLPVMQARAALAKAPPPRKEPLKTVMFAGPALAPRTVIVERKPSRRISSGAQGLAAVSRRTSLAH